MGNNSDLGSSGSGISNAGPEGGRQAQGAATRPQEIQSSQKTKQKIRRCAGDERMTATNGRSSLVDIRSSDTSPVLS